MIQGSIAKNSLLVIASFSIGQLLWNLVGGVFNGQIQFFYENELQLDVWFYTFAFLIYTIWNMFNDPLAGYMGDRTTRFTQRWGKRYPWIIAFGIPWCLSLILVFLPISTAQWGQMGVFFWLLFSICLFDTLLSFWNTNWVGLTPDKFRDSTERKQIGAFGTLMGTIGGFLGGLIPPVIAKYGNIPSYFTMAVIVAVIGLISVFLMIPGSRETKKMKERRLILDSKGKESFFKILVEALKEKNFIAYCLAYLLWQTCTQLFTTSIPYVNSWVLGLPKSYEVIPLIFYLITTLASTPLWYKLAVKYGCRKIAIIGFLICTITAAFGMLMSTLVHLIILFCIIGIGVGAFWTTMTAMVSDVMDEVAIKTGKRDEGTYMGVRTFIARLAIGIQVILLAIVHTATNYIPGDPTLITQTPEALFGILLLTSGIPAIIFLIATIIMWRIYDITVEKEHELKIRLDELKL